MILIEKQNIIYKRIILFKIHVKTLYEEIINNKFFIQVKIILINTKFFLFILRFRMNVMFFFDNNKFY
jgi:hypothetical protein